MKISGIDCQTGKAVEVSFSQTIDGITHGHPLPSAAEQTYLAPAWIDIQVNGFAGVDYNAPETPQEEIARSIHAQFAAGVARLFPTVVTGTFERISGCLRNLARARSSLVEGAAIEGFHVEGPYVSPEDGPRGAHLREFVRSPDLDEFLRFQEFADGYIKILTVAPEWPESPRFIEEVVRRGVKVSIGHTNASGEQIKNAVRAGATMSTHLGNAALSVLPRHPNLLWEQLAEDHLMASFIVDGFHLPASFLRAAWHAKGPSRSILVTDASTPAGSTPGAYKVGKLDVELHEDGSIRVAGGTRLAGSSLSMSDAISNVVHTVGISWGEAVQAATGNPAIATDMPGRQKGLAEGERADFVKFELRSSRVCVLETYVGGSLVFRRG